MRWTWISIVTIASAWTSLSLLQAQVADKSFQEGKKLFEASCADCHRMNGQGLPAKFPALDKSSFVLGEPNKVIDTVLFGRKGQLGQMPSWKDTMNDQQAAEVITYVRQAWSNKGSAVTAEMVKKRRK
jgi:mono/diheme cytochrome c family protein